MSDIHALARAHFEAKRGDLHRLDIPELGEDAAIWYYPYPTGAEIAAIMQNEDRSAVVFETVFQMARAENGARLFNAVNRNQLENAWDFAILLDICNRMGVLRQVDPSEEDEAKKE